MAPAPVIGIGAISSLGSNASQGFSAVIRAQDGISPLSLFDSGLKTPPLCAQVNTIPGSENAPNKTAALALCAARESLACIENRGNLSLGIVVATTVAGMARSERFYERLRQYPAHIEDANRELAFHEPTALSGFLCGALNAKGFYTLSTACSTGLHAVGMAKRLVETGTYDLCVAIGADALSLLTIRGFSSLMLIDPAGCKPFDALRAGISLGEGAGALCLASQKALRFSGARPLAFVSGWGASADCYHMTAPHPDGAGAALAVQAALNEAGCRPADIDLIATHGTATPDNDIAEINAMRTVFGKIPLFCSMKRSLGHTLAASGVLEAVFSVCALQQAKVPPTAGFSQPDDKINASPARFQQKELRHVLKNSFGFGGNNAAVVLSHADCGL
ncbi:MAG: beta-ketoacyl-[acyl-carrier-protein] synthase family protein [Chitinivibrionales bacterium]